MTQPTQADYARAADVVDSLVYPGIVTRGGQITMIARALADQRTELQHEFRVEILYTDPDRWGVVEGQTFRTLDEAKARISFWEDYYILPRQFRVTERTLSPWKPVQR